MNALKLKICGMRDPENIRDVIKLNPDYIGFIFYSGSPRYAGELVRAESLSFIPESVKKVGVFVDDDFDSIVKIARETKLDIIQLHGKESPDLCSRLREAGYGIFKAVSVGEGIRYSDMEPFAGLVDYFLFDTKGMLHGGSGMSFDWGILNDYPFDIPFLLSGGISLENIGQVKMIQSKYLAGLDVNSRFEITPGIKDMEKLSNLKEIIRQM